MTSAATCRTKDTPAFFSRLSTANSPLSPTRNPPPRQPFHRIRVQHRVGSTEHGSYIDEPLALITGSGATAKTYFYHANHLYSVAAMTDAAGAVTERYRYDAYGKRTALAADGVTLSFVSAAGNQIGFTGRYLDQETGMWYFRARYYSPTLGRFVGRDSWRSGETMGGYHDGFNLYQAYFCPNSLDPTGNYQNCQQIYDDYLRRCQNPNMGLGIPAGECPSAAAIRRRQCEEANQRDGGSSVGCASTFLSVYGEMREANWKNSDKYFHCKANCLCTKANAVGAAGSISDFREWMDQAFGDSADQSAADQAANAYGRTVPVHNDYICQCVKYRPNGLPDRY